VLPPGRQDANPPRGADVPANLLKSLQAPPQPDFTILKHHTQDLVVDVLLMLGYQFVVFPEHKMSLPGSSPVIDTTQDYGHFYFAPPYFTRSFEARFPENIHRLIQTYEKRILGR
jgi:hypothetical protein